MDADAAVVAPAAVIELADPSDIAAHVADGRKRIVFFEMTSCPYCSAYRGRFADLVRERPDLAYLRVKIDDPRNPLWERYGIGAVPTFIAFAGGAVVARADAVLALGLAKSKWLEFLAGI